MITTMAMISVLAGPNTKPFQKRVPALSATFSNDFLSMRFNMAIFLSFIRYSIDPLAIAFSTEDSSTENMI